jgi:hypothetical protein
LLSTINNSYITFNLNNWARLQDRYANYIDDNIVGQQLIVFNQGSDEVKWIEEQIISDVNNFTGLTHKIKVAVLGGLCGGNILREHIDGYYPPRPDACNWSLNIPIKNYENFKMEWFEGEYIPTERQDKPNLTSVFIADEMQHLRPKWVGERRLKDSAIISSPTIVQINIPHQVQNHSKNTRVVLAVRFTPDIGIK